MGRRSRKRLAKRHSLETSNNIRAGKLFMKRFGLVTTLALCAGSAVCSAQTPLAPAAPGPAPGPTAAGNGAPLIMQNPEPLPGPSAMDFTVTNIRLEGLQRISEGTVYNYLPVNIGDHVSAVREL
jgi:outer membrane protein assembly factor BamA